MSDSIDIRRVTLTALMGALIFVLTRAIQIATPVQGYIHLGDAGVFFSALAFGPTVAAIAGGLGTALADVTSGYAQWAIFSLLIHGFRGWLIGVIAYRDTRWPRLAFAILVSTLAVMLGYFIAGTILLGAASAVLELLPNAIQGLSGGLLGLPLYLAVRKAYPPLLSYSRRSA